MALYHIPKLIVIFTNRKLMDGMIQASLDVDRFKQFCAILYKANYKPFVISMQTQLAIYFCENAIKEKIKLKSLVPLLLDEDVLTSSEAQNLLDPTDDKPEEMLLSYLHLKDADKCSTFLHCLKRGSYHSLVRNIEEELSKLHLNDYEKGKKKKVSLSFTSRDSGIFSPLSTPMTSVQVTDSADGLSKLAIVEEEGSCDDLDLKYTLGMISEELDLLNEQYSDGLERLERYYEEMMLILDEKMKNAQRKLGQLHWRQKKDLEAVRNAVTRSIKRGESDQKVSGKINWFLPQAKPDVYMKITTDIATMDQFKGWDITVIIGSAHYSTTTAQGLGLKWAYSNKVALFTVEFRDIQNQPLIAKSVNDMVELTSNFDCVIIDSEGSIVPTEQQIAPSPSPWVEGIKTITYMPTVTGYLDISLKCSGHPISGSPFKVLVYPLCAYYNLMTEPQVILHIKETIMGLTFTSSGHAAICTKNGRLYIVKHIAGEYHFVDVTAYHGGLSLNFPCGISCDSNDNLVVANTRNLQLVKASSPEVKERLLISSELKFEPVCVAAHDRMVAAGGARDVVICNHNLDILHTITFSSSLSALTIADNLNVHVAVSETFGDKHYNYACIENIDSKAYKTRFAHLSPSKTTNHGNRMNGMVIDKEHNIIVCYSDQPTVAMFNSNGELLSCYENWGENCSGEFSTVAVSQNNGLLLVDQTRNKLLESHCDHRFGTYTLLEETDYL